MRRVSFTVAAGALPLVVLACTASTHPPQLADCDGPCYVLPQIDAALRKDVATIDTGVADTGTKDAPSDVVTAPDSSTNDAGADAGDASLD